MVYLNESYKGYAFFPQGYCSEAGRLEYLISKSEPLGVKFNYHKENSFSDNFSEKSPYSQRLHRAYHFPVDMFLNSQREIKPITEDNGSVIALVEQAFLATTNKPFPRNIVISICSARELKQAHSRFGAWSDGILGFVIPGDIHQIFIQRAPLDELLLVIGHEIGHIHTSQLPNIHDEEAKAFSFSIEWANKIREHNIGDLRECIKEEFNFNPAKNGLHDLAFFFVKHLLARKHTPMQIHNNLAKGYFSFFGLYMQASFFMIQL